MIELSDAGITVRVIADSRASASGVRCTTIAATYPRFIHAEVNTHKDLSRNAASSRAIPGSRMSDMVRADPAVPVHFGANEPGMQASKEVEDPAAARLWWLEGQELMLRHHQRGLELGIHKQVVNRILEPWMKITTVLTATRWGNMLFQRCHPKAQPEFQKLAYLIQRALLQSRPEDLAVGQWHVPFIREEDIAELGRPEGLETMHPLLRVSVARCARVSYLTQDGRRSIAEDKLLCDRLEHADEPEEPGHWSPFEHVAMAVDDAFYRSGNLHGFLQLRKTFAREYYQETTP